MTPPTKDLFIIHFVEETQTERTALLFEDGDLRIPMIGDEDRIQSFIPHAKEIAQKTGKTIGISRYTFSGEISISDLKGA